MGSSGAQVLLTGVTGFVGKVVLEHLIREQEIYGIAAVHALIRPKGGNNPEERFTGKIAKSRCFENLPDGWTEPVKVVAGEMTEGDLGLNRADLDELTANVTHIIHCAATIEFDLPIKEAASANITGALNVLEFARSCPNLVAFTNCSTAYVTPSDPNDGPLEEVLPEFPYEPEQIYQRILADPSPETTAEWLTKSRHPNTYTFTKCLSELLLAERRGEVPITFVRPSIVSVSHQFPRPGWIDSKAAFAGFLFMIGAGYMHTVVGDPKTPLDVVPCDIVAKRLLEATFEEDLDRTTLPILYAVAGREHSHRIGDMEDVLINYFTNHRTHREPFSREIGSRGDRVDRSIRKDFAVIRRSRWLAKLLRRKKDVAATERLETALGRLHEVFPHFTHTPYDFQPSRPIGIENFSSESYIGMAAHGVWENLLGGNEREMTIGGRGHTLDRSDRAWAKRRGKNSRSVRATGRTVRRTLRRISESVTFDRPSFIRATKTIEPDDVVILTPSHRAFFDFVLCSYLPFERQDIGLSLPVIAAAQEFSKVPILGKWITKHAFYVNRGGGPDQKLNATIQRHVDAGRVLEFFIEGTRSRGRRFLPPKRGVLRALQATGRRFVLLPIATSYDRVTEQSIFQRELEGRRKPKMRLTSLLRWTLKTRFGGGKIGRIHMACGDPIIMDGASDVHQISHDVIDALQQVMVASTHHLTAFEMATKGVVRAEDMRRLLEERGTHIIESSHRVPFDLTPEIERAYRMHWQHRFYPELMALHGKDVGVRTHIEHNSYAPLTEPRGLDDPTLVAVLERLAKDLREDHDWALWAADQACHAGQIPSAADLVRGSQGFVFQPEAEALLEAFAASGVLVDGDGGRKWSPDAIDQLATWQDQEEE